MDGLPDAIVALTANNAVAAGHDLATATQGPWKFTLDWSVYWAVQRYATSRRLRETIYLANQAIASAAPFDNAPIMQQMIQLRRDRAQLLGFESYAAMGLEDKMAPSVSAVQDLIDGMRNKFRPLGEAEVADVSAYAASQGAVLPLQKWDFSFWAVKLRKQRYDLHDDLVQSYFPLPRVLDGLFEFVARLFGLRIEAADTPQETWHPDVQYYQIRAQDQPGTPVISQFYLDLYERGDEKKAGAWIEVMVGRSSVLRTDDKAHVRIPVFALMFNFAAPAPLPSTTPTLLSFSNVTLLFHCLGYGLRIALTSAEHTAASRPHGVEWDAVEVPSQLMANFCYHRPTIQMVSGHVVTGEPLPDSIFDKLVASRRFVAAVKMLPQLQKASLDLSLHHSFDSTASSESMFALSFTLAKQFDVLPSLESDKSLCSLSHIFSGLYAAGYYSYTWSEVMSSDAYGRFKEANDEDEWKAVGRDCRDTLFALLGKAHPLDAFKSFRRRPPNADALLKDYGLI
ncbi:hypothetical protein, variant [Aphanomyces astaci]|nr:hypothetical protein, variant [Aphanomyces astaci]ETV86285.1 hypothetical protein, variant [Aphanomyces astaci]|eukprot:XP_009824757.1 hypothetical protein, variant [Aphanomyces astaci]